MKAIALISGGLDSALAAKVIKMQGIDILGVAFCTPFMFPRVDKLADNIGIQIKLIDVSAGYLDLVKNPRYGFGSNLNPCIDCHIFMLRKAKEMMLRQEASFIISGEVLGQRPMSQNGPSLMKIEKESGLEGLLLRPLSAQLLPATIPEQATWVERNKLFAFSGRSRRPQMELAKQLSLEGFSQPAGGCLLTDPGFSRRLKDLLDYQKNEFNLEHVNLLKIGRHFRISPQAKLILGRNQGENERLADFAGSEDIVLEPADTPGPTGLLTTSFVSQGLLELSARIIAHYCDDKGQLRISIQGNKHKQVINCCAIDSNKLDGLRI